MTAQSLFTTILNVSNILRELETAGLRLTIGADFVAYRRLRDSQTDRLPLYPIFDISSSFIDASNAFWACAFNDRNELVHTQVIRIMDLSETTLQDHLREHRHKYLSPGMVTDADEISFSPLPSLATITGRVCYHGEFWLKGGDRSLRGQGFTALMSRIVLEIALKTWRPDYLFGFVPMKLAMNGIPFRYGYTRCEVGAWLRNEDETAAEEALVWMSRSDLEQFLKTSPNVVSLERNLPAKEEQPQSMVLRA